MMMMMGHDAGDNVRGDNVRGDATTRDICDVRGDATAEARLGGARLEHTVGMQQAEPRTGVDVVALCQYRGANRSVIFKYDLCHLIEPVDGACMKASRLNTRRRAQASGSLNWC